MYRFDPGDHIPRLRAEHAEGGLLNLPNFTDEVNSLIELMAERQWEMFLTNDEWKMLGAVYQGGLAVDVIPDDMRECHCLMRWALGIVRQWSDYEFQGIDASEGDAIWLKSERPLGITRQWNNDWYILGTMYDTKGNRIDGGLPTGTPIQNATVEDITSGNFYFPDPDWRVILPFARDYLAASTTRCHDAIPSMILAAERMLGEILEASKTVQSPKAQEVVH